MKSFEIWAKKELSENRVILKGCIYVGRENDGQPSVETFYSC